MSSCVTPLSQKEEGTKDYYPKMGLTFKNKWPILMGDKILIIYNLFILVRVK
jgi:hypothetical protein